MSSLTPRIVSYGSDLERFYPAAAYHAGIRGEVVVRVALDETGRLTEACVLSESPRAEGFGAAALNLVQTCQYANPTGLPTAFEFKVNFEPQKPTSPDHVTNGVP